MDVHAINDLQKKGFPPTDDSSKYNYTSDDQGNYSTHFCFTEHINRMKLQIWFHFVTTMICLLAFESCTGTVKALRFDKAFVSSVTSGQECGVLLDKTCFYAEQGGQTFDLGFMVNTDDEVICVTVYEDIPHTPVGASDRSLLFVRPKKLFHLRRWSSQ